MKLPASRIFLSVLIACGTLVAAQPALAGKVTVKNCSSSKWIFAAFNDTDHIMAIPFSQRTLSAGQSGTLSCLGAGCRLTVRKDDFTPQYFFRTPYSGSVHLNPGMQIRSGSC
ncbi:MAG: hypothetical protein IOC86_00840 [Aestuariivirga sp.]|nr:hypothetical protein [Aestuariivirga sp.]